MPLKFSDRIRIFGEWLGQPRRTGASPIGPNRGVDNTVSTKMAQWFGSDGWGIEK